MVNLTQLIKDMLFVSSDKNNPTQVTPAQFNGLTKAEIDVLMKKKANKSALPFTQYGDQTFLPINASGSFEGASLNGPGIVGNIEPDGTILMLRCGSDGRKFGVYYAQVVMTNGVYTSLKPLGAEYKPAFFPDGYWADFVCQSVRGQIVGHLRNAAGDTSRWFVARTNGTLDATKHEGFILTGSVWSEGGLYLTPDNVVWAFSSVSVQDDGHRIQVATGPVTAGATNPIGLVTNWTCNGITVPYTDTHIRFSGAKQGTDPATDPYVLSSGPNVSGLGPQMGRNYIEITPLSATTFSLLYSHETWVGLANGAADRPWIVRQFTVDIAAKTATITDDTRGTVTMVNNGTSITVGGNAKRDPGVARPGWVGNNVTCLSHLNDGRVLSSMYQNSQMTVFLSNNTYTTDQLRSANRNLTPNVSKGYDPLYGSPIGSQVYAITPHTWDRVIVRTLWGDGNSSRWQLVSVPLSDTLVDYRLPNGRLTKSYQLGTDRRLVTPARPLVMHLTEYALGGCRRSHCFTRNRLTGCSNLDENYQGADDITIPVGHFQDVESAALLTVKAKGVSPDLAKVKSAIYIPQITGSAPPFAIVHVGYNTNCAAVVHVSLNFNGQKTGVMPSPGITSAVADMDWFNGSQISIDYSEQDTPGINLYESSGFAYITGTAPIWEGHVGNGCFMGLFATVNSAGTWNIRAKNPTYVYATDGENHLMMHPKFSALGGGNVVVRGSGAVGADSGYCAVGIYSTQADGINGDTSKEAIIATQAVVNGWIVYITDTIPCSVPGVNGTVPVTTVDLTTIANPPSNNTFYFYVELSAGVFSYKVSTTPLATSLSRLYIGNVTTNEVGIDKINIKKVIGIGGFSLSADKVGSAIPISTGLPNVFGNLTW